MNECSLMNEIEIQLMTSIQFSVKLCPYNNNFSYKNKHESVIKHILYSDLVDISIFTNQSLKTMMRKMMTK